MKKVIAIVLLVALVSAISIGATLAYLTDRDSEVNVFTIGDVTIDLEEEFEQNSTLIPGVKIEKKPTITNTGKNDAWVWLNFAIPAALDVNTPGSDVGSVDNVIHWNFRAATTEGYVNQDKVDKAIADGFLTDATLTADKILSENMTWDVMNSIAAGNNVRCVSEVVLYPDGDEGNGTPEPGNGFWIGLKGTVTNPENGEYYNKVNMSVLNAESGTIFTAGETIHLEGYAFAFNWPITGIDFSLDGGETWIEVDTPDVANEHWVYWRADINGLAAGSYVLTMRAHAVNIEDADYVEALQANGAQYMDLDDLGQELATYYMPQFLINVEDPAATAAAE